MAKNLTTREARRRHKRQHAPHWSRIHKGLIVGWRRNASVAGTWYVRWLGEDKKYHQDRLGEADDDPKSEPDGEQILTYQQALEKAMKRDNSGQEKPVAHYSVWDACEDWLDDYQR